LDIDEIICFYGKTNIIEYIKCIEDGQILMENKKDASHNSHIILQNKINFIIFLKIKLALYKTNINICFTKYQFICFCK
jgi:hypothetical protein